MRKTRGIAVLAAALAAFGFSSAVPAGQVWFAGVDPVVSADRYDGSEFANDFMALFQSNAPRLRRRAGSAGFGVQGIPFPRIADLVPWMTETRLLIEARCCGPRAHAREGDCFEMISIAALGSCTVSARYVNRCVSGCGTPWFGRVAQRSKSFTERHCPIGREEPVRAPSQASSRHQRKGSHTWPTACISTTWMGQTPRHRLSWV